MCAAPLKNGLGKPAIERLASNIQSAWPDFDRASFARKATRGLTRLELKERVGHVADALASHLPDRYPQAIEVVTAAAGGWDRGDEDDPLRGFAAWPLFHFIEHHGVDDFKRSMSALRMLTHLFTGEFAVRPYIDRYPDRAFKELMRWTRDPSEHVRRLASEGCRPRLPWASRVPLLLDEPQRIVPVLEQLKDDPELYVRRSVANNLNDVGKDHPELLVDVCKRWSKGADDNRQWLVRHALRSLVKKGNPGALRVLGYGAASNIEVAAVKFSPRRVNLGNTLKVSFVVRNKATKKQALLVDYAVHYVKANGSRSAKVFKLKKLTVPARGEAALAAMISFAPISTRTYYPGKHQVDVLVNGATHVLGEFQVTN